MKTFLLILTAFMLLCISCEDESGPEEYFQDPPDNEITGNGTLDKDQSESPDIDNGTGSITEQETPDEGAGDPFCGDGKINGDEACDSDFKDCSRLNAHWTGVADCRTDCRGYKIKSCKMDAKDVYGSMWINADLSYILDGSRLSENSYKQQGISNNFAFMAVYDENLRIPPVESDRTDVWSFSVQGENARKYFIHQQSFSGGTPLYPIVELEFAEGALFATDYYVNAVDLFILNAKMVRMRLIEMNGSQECLQAIATSGKIEVTAVDLTNPIEGGHLSLHGTGIEFYHPQMKPELQDLPMSVLGRVACPYEQEQP